MLVGVNFGWCFCVAVFNLTIADILVLPLLVSAVVGVFALKLLIEMLKKARFHVFGYYCWALGLVALIVHWTAR
jgi:undecaprenyl-diphosphatase